MRRALGAKQPTAELAHLRAAFLAGAQARGVPEPIAQDVYRQVSAFGGYAFPKSHAAAFAVLVYQSAFLKCYHPLPFTIALLNHQPMGFWSPAVIVRDAQRRGVRVGTVDIQRSAIHCSREGDTLRLGLQTVRGIGTAAAERIVAARAGAPFRDLLDLQHRTNLSRRLIARLVQVGACDGWGIPRRQLLWTLGGLHADADELPLPVPDVPVTLPPLAPATAQQWEQTELGLTVGHHRLITHRAELTERGIRGYAALAACAAGEHVRVAGELVRWQAPPTAKGHHFLTLEDEDGLINVILCPHHAAQASHILRRGGLLLVSGKVQQQRGVLHVVARTVSPPQVEAAE
jgi:error-prone DNA polymerase